MLEKHRCLPAKQLEQDHNGARIVVAWNFLKSALIRKRGTIVYCWEFNMPQFLAENDWRTVGEFEAILRDTLRLNLVYQNEENLNGTHGPAMRKSLHDSLSRETMQLINAEQWNSDKEMTHPTRSEVNVNSVTKAGKKCKKREFLEYERRFFNNALEITFADYNTYFFMNLSH